MDPAFEILLILSLDFVFDSFEVILRSFEVILRSFEVTLTSSRLVFGVFCFLWLVSGHGGILSGESISISFFYRCIVEADNFINLAISYCFNLGLLDLISNIVVILSTLYCLFIKSALRSPVFLFDLENKYYSFRSLNKTNNWKHSFYESITTRKIVNFFSIITSKIVHIHRYFFVCLWHQQSWRILQADLF